MGIKNPKIMLDDYDYRLYRKLEKRTVWLCSQYYSTDKETRCKNRIETTGRIAYVSGTIYFDVGHKNPKIIVDRNSYLMYRKLPDKTVWLCTQYHKKDRCKAKVMTRGRQAIIIGDHNHQPTYLNVKNMTSQVVSVKKANNYEECVQEWGKLKR
ncbi:unnamed protein product [Diabrotica balteata]|uniref:FLYWCH-type domain-containing protein n=1 Tax=Diabrotica balteata TaxID=107213 RepID=A0A9N9SUW7_DIABA|nr:unnamed protein product [Diabrotica balteata]